MRLSLSPSVTSVELLGRALVMSWSPLRNPSSLGNEADNEADNDFFVDHEAPRLNHRKSDGS